MPAAAEDLSSVIKSCRTIMRKDKGLSGELDRLPLLTWILLLKFLDAYDAVREAEAELAGMDFRATIEAPYRWRDWGAADAGLTGDDLLSFVNAERLTFPDGSKGAGLLRYLRQLQGADGRDRRDVIATVFDGVENRMRSGYLLRDVLNKIDTLHLARSSELELLGHVYETMLRELRDAAGDSGEFYTPRPVVKFMVEAVKPRLGEIVLDPACGTGGFLVEAHRVLQEQCRTTEDFQILQTSLRGGEAKPLPYLLAQMNLVLHGVEDPDIDPGNSLRHKLVQLGEADRVDVILTNPPFGGEEERGVLANFPPDRRTTETAALFLQLILRKLRRGTEVAPGGRCAVVVSDGFLSTRGVLSKIKEDLMRGANLHTVVRLPKGVFAPYTPIKTNLLFFDYGKPTDTVWFYEVPKPQGRQMYTKTKPLPYEELGSILEDWWEERAETDRAWSVSAEDLRAREFDLDIVNPHHPVDAASHSPAQIIALAQVAAATLHDDVRMVEKRLEQLPTPQSPNVVPLSAAVTQRKEWITLQDDEDYQLATVSLHGRGIRPRGTKSGGEIKMKQQQMLRANDLLVAEIDAKVGGYGLVPPALEGAVVSSHYFVYEVDENVVNMRFLDWYLRSGLAEMDVQQYVKGSTNYASIRQHHFPLLELNLPARDWQDEFVARMGEVAAAADAALVKVDALQTELRAVLPSVLMRTFAPADEQPVGEIERD